MGKKCTISSELQKVSILSVPLVTPYQYQAGISKIPILGIGGTLGIQPILKENSDIS